EGDGGDEDGNACESGHGISRVFWKGAPALAAGADDSVNRCRMRLCSMAVCALADAWARRA
ncbi:MAG: hypothetical protein ACJ8GO_13605, partial [Ramlibacter sp.]